MAKHKNQQIWSDDRAYLQGLAEDLDKYIGRDYRLDLKQGLLVIFALPRKYKKKTEREKPARDKRNEKFERREK